MNIYQRRDGRWEGRIPNGKTPDGKRKFQYVLSKSKETVIEKITQICGIQKSQDCIMTVSDLFSEWYQSALCRIKESTAANYMMKAQKHILPAFGDRIAGEIASDEIYQFIQEKQNTGLSVRYVSDIIVLMKTIYKYAVSVYHIFNPLEHIRLPKKKTPEIQLLDKSEQKKLQDYISEHQNETTLGVALSMSTGIRIGELCALQWKDIDLEKRILTVRKTMQRIQCPTETAKTRLIITEPKSESSKRNIPIPDCMIDFLKKYKNQADTYLLSGTDKPVEPRTMQYRFRAILKNAELPSVHFHALRHIFASSCIRLGFDVKALSELLGHSSVEITLNRYVHSDFEQKKSYMNRLKLNF